MRSCPLAFASMRKTQDKDAKDERQHAQNHDDGKRAEHHYLSSRLQYCQIPKATVSIIGDVRKQRSARNQAPRQARHSCNTPLKDAMGNLPHPPIPVYLVTNPRGNNARPRGIAWRSIIRSGSAANGLAGFIPSQKTESALTASFMLVFRALEPLFSSHIIDTIR